MPIISCPRSDCQYATEDVEAVVAAALLNIHATTHSASGGNSNSTNTSARPPPIERPKLQINSPRAEFEVFSAKWRSFKVAAGIAGDKAVHQLLGCLDGDLGGLVYNEHASPETLSEEELLGLIERVAVKPENIWVTREVLHSMKQDSGESVTSFAARLKGQARLCKFQANKKCSKEGCNQVNSYDFTDTVIMGDLVRGLGDAEIKSTVLGEVEQKSTLKDLIELIQAKEYGRNSVIQAPTINAVSNQTPRKSCPNCGGSHAKGTTWKEFCPARDKHCTKCEKIGHFAKVCRSGEKSSKASRKSDRNAEVEASKADEEASAIENDFAYLFAFETAERKHDKKARQRRSTLDKLANIQSHKSIPSMKWEQDNWVLKSSSQSPMVNIKYKLCWDGYVTTGFPIPIQTVKSRPKSKGPLVATAKAMADTGCSQMIAGVDFIENIGIKNNQLIPVDTVVKAANKTVIKVDGAVIVEIRLNTPGADRSTKQIVYISPMATKTYLSLDACKHLGLVPECFPKVTTDGAKVCEVEYDDGFLVNSSELEVEKSCSCPRRTLPPEMPTKLPFPETEVEKIKDWIVNRYKSSTFNTCEHQPLPKMKGEPLRIYMREDAKPYVVHTPSPIPVHFRQEVKEQLDRDVRLGVLEKVPPNTPTTWCSRLVIATKKNGTPRRTVDLQALNNGSVRQTHNTRNPYHLAREIPANTKKTTFDAWNGYHSVPLHPDDKHYTTFITEFGRYRYCSSPQGYLASNDGYTQRYCDIVKDELNKVQCVDDTCQWEWSVKDSFFQTCRYITTCGNSGIVLNPDKFSFAQDVVDFAGFEIGPDYVKPSKHLHEAIAGLARPQTLTDVRAFFGLVEQISYTCHKSKVMAPFRELLKPNNAVNGKVYWDDELDESFNSAKVAMIEAMEEGVKIFDKERPTSVDCDWSKAGIGHTLSQKHCSCQEINPDCCPTGWRVCAFASRFCHPAEANYSPVEGEALSGTSGLHKFRHFVLGCKTLFLVVDHKPLVKLFGDRKLEEIDNMRLLKLKEKTLPYRFTVHYRPGKKNIPPDFGSRYPYDKPHLELADYEQDIIEEIEVAAHDSIMQTWDTSEIITIDWRMVKAATMEDDTLCKLKEMIQTCSDAPDARMVPTDIRPFVRKWDSLWVQDDVILMGNRTVIPTILRQRVLDCLHSAHQGVSQMVARADLAVYWPNMHQDLEQVRHKCATCRQHAPSNPNLPPHDQPDLEFPFQQVCADYMSLNGIPYLVVVDRLTGWPSVLRAKNNEGGSAGLIKCLRELFCTFGISEELASDGGTEFTSGDVQKFLRKYGVKHRLSSVGNPHSNQRAEVGVKSMKRLLRGNLKATGSLDDDSFARAILQYRNTPLQSTGLSPAIALFGHPIRDFLPLSRQTYSPAIQWVKKIACREQKMSQSRDKAKIKWSEHSRKQDPLRVGHVVSIQNLAGNHPLKWDRTGLVIEAMGNDQYQVKVDGTGRITLRNRKHLKPIGYRKPADPFPSLPSLSSAPLSGEGNKDKSTGDQAETMLGGQANKSVAPSESDQSLAPQSLTPRSLAPQTPVTPMKNQDQSMSFHTPVAMSTPIRPLDSSMAKSPVVSSKSVIQDPSPVKLYHQLRAHNKPGLKEVPVDITGPRATRSGKALGSKEG